MMIRKVASLVLAGALGLVAVAAATAQEPPRRSRGGHVIQLPEQEIEGRRQMPAQFVLVRSETGYQVVEQRPDLVREIVRSTRSGAF